LLTVAHFGIFVESMTN